MSAANLKLPYMTRRKSDGHVYPSWRCRFRHPVVNKIISNGAGTRDDAEALKIAKSLSLLIKNPLYHDPNKVEEAARKGLHPRALKLFYKPMGDAWLQASRIVAVYEDAFGAMERVDSIQSALDEGLQYKAKCEILERKIEALESAIKTGQTSHLFPTLTVAEVYQVWCEEFECRSDRERKFVLRRVKFGIESVSGLKLCELTAQKLKDSIQICMNVPRGPRKVVSISAHELNRRIRDCKRFMAWCFETYEIRSLKKVIAALRYSSPETVARRQEIKLLDAITVKSLLNTTAKGLFESESEATYWRGFIAVLVFAGLRLSEIAAIRWDDIDFEAELISIVDSVAKDLKTTKSNRVVRPLPEVWPLLQQLRSVTGNFGFVFPYENRGTYECRSWLAEEDGKMIAKLLTRKLIRLEPTLGLGRQIAQRARRTCRTEMLKRGVPAHVVDLMLGHSADVGRAHYTHTKEVVSAFHYPQPQNQ